jgi:hypothetical protein
MLGFCGPLDLEKPAKVCSFLSQGTNNNFA